jgi:hypothetical protein
MIAVFCVLYGCTDGYTYAQPAVITQLLPGLSVDSVIAVLTNAGCPPQPINYNAKLFKVATLNCQGWKINCFFDQAKLYHIQLETVAHEPNSYAAIRQLFQKQYGAGKSPAADPHQSPSLSKLYWDLDSGWRMTLLDITTEQPTKVWLHFEIISTTE